MATKITAFCTSIGIGICNCHEIPIPMVGIVVGSPLSKSIQGQGNARTGDLVIGTCGHVGIIITGSGSIKSNNISQATVGSIFGGCFNGTIASGAATHMSGE